MFSCLFLQISFAQEGSTPKDRGETITLTTYYPAPFGVYKTLRLSPSTPVDKPKEGEIYYDEQEHTLKCYTGDKWGGIVWFGNAGIFLKEGAVAIAPYSIDEGRIIFRGQAKYEQGMIYTRIKILDKSEKIVCDSDWQQGFKASCYGNGYNVDALTNAFGITLRVSFKAKAKEREYNYVFQGEWQ